jgi:hypothetical protein
MQGIDGGALVSMQGVVAHRGLRRGGEQEGALCVCRVAPAIVDCDEESEHDGRISDSAGVAHGASRVASRGANRTVRGRRQGEQTGWCASVFARRCRPSWTEARRASRVATSALSVGSAHGASRVA